MLAKRGAGGLGSVRWPGAGSGRGRELLSRPHRVWGTAGGSQMESVEKTANRSEQKSSRKFLKSLIRKQPQELLLVIGTGVSAAVAPGIPALCSWRSCIEAVIEAAEQLEVLHPGDVAEFRRKVTKDQDLLVVAHDLIRKMSPRTGDTKPNFFQDCLMEVFDSLEQYIQNPAVLQSILSLMDRGTMVLTTNYDNLLELFGQQQNKPMESLDLKDKTKVLQWARGHVKYGVLHIHGLYTDPCGMVLDPSGYKDVTQDPEVMSCRTCTAPSPSCSWAAGRPCVTRSSRPCSSTRCRTRWTWSTTCWCSRRTRTTSSSTRRTCCCTASRWCPTGTASPTSRATCRTWPRASAGSPVQMRSAWTAPRCWGARVRTVRRGS
ncbi:protein FAM118A isoform X3 [Oryctolagus cuniculus]|uniref:protein FAM118A isoform X3 n=1 Tax=Oryctolagus cuniculus TaxID=9986 RepID=UPI00387A1617